MEEFLVFDHRATQCGFNCSIPRTEAAISLLMSVAQNDQLF
jgi:hypothetical protein